MIRHWLMLLPVVVALCFASGWYGTTLSGRFDHLPPDQRAAARHCESLDGNVIYEITAIELGAQTASLENSAADPENPPKQVDDATLEKLKNIPTLRKLYLIGSNVTDAGLANLKELKKLQVLEMSSSMDFTDAGLEHLKEIASLKMLIIRGCTQISPKAKADLRRHFKEVYFQDLLITGP